MFRSARRSEYLPSALMCGTRYRKAPAEGLQLTSWPFLLLLAAAYVHTGRLGVVRGAALGRCVALILAFCLTITFVRLLASAAVPCWSKYGGTAERRALVEKMIWRGWRHHLFFIRRLMAPNFNFRRGLYGDEFVLHRSGARRHNSWSAAPAAAVSLRMCPVSDRDSLCCRKCNRAMHSKSTLYFMEKHATGVT